MNRFWNWIRNKDPDGKDKDRTLILNGTIAEESWFDDEVTPALFKSELESGSGDVTVWINSPGGDCFAAAQIYNMLIDYAGRVTVKIDGIAASAASVIAMAGDKVFVSPVSMIMIHNPATIAIGDHNEMQRAIDTLAAVKDSIINAYVTKTGLSRNKLSKLMEDETWMDANKAVELRFADSVIRRESMYAKENPDEEDDHDEGTENDSDEKPDKETEKDPEKGSENDPKKKQSEGLKSNSMMFSRRAVATAVFNKIAGHYREMEEKEASAHDEGRRLSECEKRLELIGRMI